MIASGIFSADEFCIDEIDGVAYISTHVANTIERVRLTSESSSARDTVAGKPFDDKLVGPSGLFWARGAEGRIAFVTSDGGHLQPGPDGILHDSALLRTSAAHRSARTFPRGGFFTTERDLGIALTSIEGGPLCCCTSFERA